MADGIKNTTNRKCYTSQEIVSNNGQVINDSNGVVSVYLPNNVGVLAPVQLTSECCKILGSEYTFDIETQKCRWAPASDDICGLKDPFKLVLNPKGNDGTIFYVDENQTCELSIDFNYLFKVSCESLADILKPVVQNQINPNVVETIKTLENQLQNLIKECSSYESQISWYQNEITNSSYSIYCNQPTGVKSTAIKNVALMEGFKQSGFAGRTSSSPLAPFSFDIADYYNTPLCLTEPDGLAALATILGPINYQAFLDGDQTSYTCDEVTTIINQNISNSLLIPAGPILFNICNIPFGTKTDLIKTLGDLLIQQQGCTQTIQTLQAELETLTATIATETNSACKTPIEFFETFNVSATLDLVSGGTIQTVATFPLFNTIGTGQLYNYLVAHPENSGFYVCGSNDIDSNCTPMTLDAADINNTNTAICDDVMNNLLTSLYAESGLSGTTNGQDSFNNALPFNGLASKWLHFNTVVSDPAIIDLITNQKIKISFEINHACGDFCVLVDEIVLDKNCTEVSYNNIFLTQSPGFELDRIRDNKKSWIANTTLENRAFSISNNLGNQSIRQTNYDVNDERLIINTKEIDLDINLAGAISTDVWCYLNDNPCILTGITTCVPCCENKTFQDDECFYFMDNYNYEFMDGSGSVLTSQFNYSNCCGDDMIDFASLMTQPISAVTTIEDFEYFLTSELIDAKNRQTISGYPTLRALYNRYMNSYLYCGNNSSKFDYLTMDQFSSLVGNYWVDIVEQVIPATTIWGSVKVYSNTIFDQQKYKYKSYTSLFCDNQFSGIPVLSPINGVSGTCANVEVITTPLNLNSSTAVSLKKAVTKCNNICIAQMNSGSEFIGSVQVVGFELDGGNSDGIGDGNNSYTIIESIK